MRNSQNERLLLITSVKNYICVRSNSDPKDLEDISLDQYFYLTRENLKKPDTIISDLSSKVKEILVKIGQAQKKGIKLSITKDVQELEAMDREDLFKALEPRIENGELNLSVVRDLFEVLTTLRVQIVEALKKMTRNITPGEIPIFTQMLKQDKMLVRPLLDGWKKNRILSDQLYNEIVSKGK